MEGGNGHGPVSTRRPRDQLHVHVATHGIICLFSSTKVCIVFGPTPLISTCLGLFFVVNPGSIDSILTYRVLKLRVQHNLALPTPL